MPMTRVQYLAKGLIIIVAPLLLLLLLLACCAAIAAHNTQRPLLVFSCARPIYVAPVATNTRAAAAAARTLEIMRSWKGFHEQMGDAASSSSLSPSTACVYPSMASSLRCTQRTRKARIFILLSPKRERICARGQLNGRISNNNPNGRRGRRRHHVLSGRVCVWCVCLCVCVRTVRAERGSVYRPHARGLSNQS